MQTDPESGLACMRFGKKPERDAARRTSRVVVSVTCRSSPAMPALPPPSAASAAMLFCTANIARHGPDILRDNLHSREPVPSSVFVLTGGRPSLPMPPHFAPMACRSTGQVYLSAQSDGGEGISRCTITKSGRG